MKIKVEISTEIDLDIIENITKPVLLTNDIILEYIINQIKNEKLREAIFTDFESGQSGNKGFLVELIERYKNK